jgi:triphosphatase
MQEIELKFLVPQSRLKGLMRQAHVKSSETTQMAAHYYDTAEQDLAQAGIGLRIRKEGDHWVQTIKAGGDGIAARLEHNTLLDSDHVQAMLDANQLMPDLSLYKDTAIAPALADFKLKKLAKKLTCQYVTDVQRITRLLTEKGNSEEGCSKELNRLEVAYDCGEVIHGNDETQRQAIQEIEFELLSGDVDFLFATAKVWCKRYKLCLSTVTKAERGGLLIQGQSYSPAVSASQHPLHINKDSSMPAFVRAAVHNCLLQILPNSSAIVAGSQDTDHALQLRIGIRRLRVALKAFKKFSDQLNPEWLPILKQTATLLGDYRPLAHLSSYVEPKLEQDGAPRVDWTADLKKIKVKPIDAVRANDFQLTLLELIAFTMSDSNNEAQVDKLAIDKLAKILSKSHSKLLKAEHQLLNLSHENDDDVDDDEDGDVDNENDDENLDNEVGDDISDDPLNNESSHNVDATYLAQHKLRCQLKNMRYLSEFAAPLYSKKKSKRWLKRLTKAQKALGQYLDKRQYQQYYQQKAATDSNALYGAGWFAATSSADNQRWQKRFARVQSAMTFW